MILYYDKKVKQNDTINVDNWRMKEIQTYNEKMSPSELLEVFPEAIPAIKRNIRILKSQENEMERIGKILVDELMVKIYMQKDLKEIHKNFFINLANRLFYNTPLNKIRKNKRKLEHLINIHNWRGAELSGSSITEADIRQAKEYPITNLIKVDKSGFAFCPFHSEKQASFKVYKDNRFHCFSCQKDGDSIDFVMLSCGIDFISAVKSLTNPF